MKLTVSCPSCSAAVVSDEIGRLPPWCSRCGSTLKAKAEAPRTPAQSAAANHVPDEPVPAAAEEPAAEATPLVTLPYFQACIPNFSSDEHELFRVYLAGNDLLVFKLGVGGVNSGHFQPRTKQRRMGTGIAGAIAQMAEMERVRFAKRIEELDTCDEAGLRLRAAAGDGSFTAAPTDLRDVRVDGPSWWYRYLCSVDHYAVLKFKHAQQGRMSLALPALSDARRAVEGLTQMFGDLVQVNLTWGSAARRAGRFE
jgi:hypothetical protein